jgi:hypothetical protein
MTITLNEMILLLSNNDPLEVYEDFMKNSKEFRGFIERNKDKSTREMIKCYNLSEIIGETKSRV